MKLSTLGPQWIRNLEEGRRRFVVAVDDRVDANGIRFRCPACEKAQVGAVHALLLWDDSVSIRVPPAPDRWEMTGSSFDDLTLDKAVRLHVGCQAWFRIINGEVQPCN